MRYSLEGLGKGMPEGGRELSVRRYKSEQRHNGLSSKTGLGSNTCLLDGSVSLLALYYVRVKITIGRSIKAH